MPAAYHERSDSQITTGELEIQWAEKLYNRLPLDDSLQDSGSNDSPKGPDSEITDIAEALNKFSSQLEQNNEVIAKKAKKSDEDKIQKYYHCSPTLFHKNSPDQRHAISKVSSLEHCQEYSRPLRYLSEGVYKAK